MDSGLESLEEEGSVGESCEAVGLGGDLELLLHGDLIGDIFADGAESDDASADIAEECAVPAEDAVVA